MARVEIPEVAWVRTADNRIAPAGGAQVTVRELDGSAADVFDGLVGSALPSNVLVADPLGRVEAFVEEGSYLLEVALEGQSYTQRLEAVSGASGSFNGRLSSVEGSRVFVAAPTGVGATDSAAVNAAIAAVPTEGGTVVFATGTYVLSSPLTSLTDRRGITLEGQAGPDISTDGTQSILVFTAATSAALISFKDGCRGITFRHLDLRYNSASYSGHLVDLRNTTGAPQWDVHDITFEHCVFRGGTSTQLTNAASFVRLANSHSILFDHCVFRGANVAVRGRDVLADYCNQVTFRSCRFIDQVLAHTVEAGGSWLFEGCTFEASVNDFPCAHQQNLLDVGGGLSYIGCWFGDATGNSSGRGHIEWHGYGLVVLGCTMYSEHANNNHIVINGNGCAGIFVAGNNFGGPGTPAVEFGATTGHTGVSVGLNSYLAGVSATGGTLPPHYIGGAIQTTVGAAGAASALPATPTKYLKVIDSTGATLVIPAYAP